MRLLGIHRDVRFSPGRHAENDRLILEATASRLERRGFTVHLMSETEVGEKNLDATAIFSMCQGLRANRCLESLERRGALIINSPIAAQKCYRGRLHRELREDWGLFAPTTLISTEAAVSIPPELAGGGQVWMKRGDVHSTQPGDVVRARTPEELQRVLADFRLRDIPEAIISPHLEGEVVKFYSVAGTPFFRFYCERNLAPSPVTFAASRPGIEQLVRRLGLEIYGGDAIVSPEGRVRIIDLNDWPSFAPFRQEAAEIIAEHIYHRTIRHKERSPIRVRYEAPSKQEPVVLD